MSSSPAHPLFSYGTLRDPAVQEGLFGSEVTTTPATVTGYVLGEVRITDPTVLALSGSDVHPGLVATGDEADRVPGVVLQLTDAQLSAADAYESAAYTRAWVQLDSGLSVWAYVPAPSPPSL